MARGRILAALFGSALLVSAALAQNPHARRTGPQPEVKQPNPPAESGPGTSPEATGGPDGFGYIFFDQADGCSFQFVDISASGTPVVTGDDTASAPIALSQPFSFYGNNFNNLVMASNGYVTTDLADTGPDLSNDCPLPTVPSTPVGTNGRRMYPFHDDLVLTGGASSGFVQFFAACPRVQDAPQACTVFQWNDVELFAAPGIIWDQEVIIYHTTGTMVAQVGPGNPDTGGASTTGIQSDPTSGASFTGLTYACNTAGSVPANTAVCFGIPAGPDLVLTKTASPPNPGIGAAVTFTITVQNSDASVSQTGVEVTDNLPATMSYVSDTCGGDFSDGVWTIGTLAAGASVSCDLVATLDGCGDTVNTATVTADVLDPPGNNSDSVTLGGGNLIIDPSYEACDPFAAPDACPDWGETSTQFGSPVCSAAFCGTGGGTAGPRTGSIWNWLGGAGAGPEDATTSQSVTIPTGASAILSLYVWNGSGTNPADFLEVTVDGNQELLIMNADPTYTGGYAQATIDVTAYADGLAHNIVIHGLQNTTTTNFSVDDVSLVVCSQADADLTITKTSDAAGPVAPGDPVVFTITVTNVGPAATATNVVAVDTLPAGVTYVSDDCGAGPPVGQTLTWNIGNLAINTPAVCNVTVTIDANTPPGALVNTATVSGDEIDPVTANNSGSTTIEVGLGFDPLGIPTLSSVGLALLLVLMAGTALYFLRRRRAA